MAHPVRAFNAEVSAPPVVRLLAGVQARCREAEFAWIRGHAQQYPGQWIAVLGDHLLGVAFELDDLLARLTPEQIGQALFHRVALD